MSNIHQLPVRQFDTGLVLTDSILADIAKLDRMNLQRAKRELAETDTRLNALEKELFSLHRKRAGLIVGINRLEAAVRA